MHSYTRKKSLLSSIEVSNVIERGSCASKIEIVKFALGKDADLHVVGGTVRDMLLNSEYFDLDLATPVNINEVVRRLRCANLRVIETGVEHGTVLVVIEENHIEITTFREPSSRYETQFSRSIEIDLEGRDFTINAIAYSLDKRVLIDPFDGQKDLENGILRAVKDPDSRFCEDPIRILRMLRFGPGDGRIVDAATLRSAKENVGLLKEASIERIKTEVERIITSNNPSDAIKLMKDIGALEFVFPELILSIGFEQNEFHIEDVFNHTLSVLSRCDKDKRLRLSALFHDSGKPGALSVDKDGRRHFYLHEELSQDLAKKALTRLRFSHDDVSAVANIVKHHMRPLDCGSSGVRRLIRDLGSDFDTWRRLKIADMTPKGDPEQFKKDLEKFDLMVKTETTRSAGPSWGKLSVNGDDLISIGFKPGSRLGACLKTLEEIVIEDPGKNSKEILLIHARQILERE